MKKIFEGRYGYPAWLHLKPIKHCFALVKEWIHSHEEETAADPVGTIYRAFDTFAIDGERADSGRGHWNGYFLFCQLPWLFGEFKRLNVTFFSCNINILCDFVNLLFTTTTTDTVTSSASQINNVLVHLKRLLL